MKSLDMSKVEEILRLKSDVGLSLRDIAASCNCGKSTVEDVLKRAQAAKIPWPCDLNDKELLSLIYPPAEARKTTAEPDLNYIYDNEKISVQKDEIVYPISQEVLAKITAQANGKARKWLIVMSVRV